MRLENFKQAVLHPSCEVHAGGWRATVESLYYNGWRFEVVEEEYTHSLAIHGRNPVTNMVSVFRIDMLAASMYNFLPTLYFSEDMVLRGDVYREMHAPLPIWSLEADVGVSRGVQPKFYLLKARETKQTEELIITPDKIPEILTKIREAQEPQARELLHKQRHRLESMQVQAKILSFGS